MNRRPSSGRFGSNPGALRMYGYVPDGLPAGRPVVVALHGCTQSASDYFGHAGWPKHADRYRAALVFPEQTTANNPLPCFNWFTPDDTGDLPGLRRARGRGAVPGAGHRARHAGGPGHGGQPMR